MENEIQNTPAGVQKTDEPVGFLAKIKGFFSKTDKTGGNDNKQKLTRAFHFTRKDSIVSIVVAILVVIGALYYGKIVFDEYDDINAHSNDLKSFGYYDNVSLDENKLGLYIQGNNTGTIDGMISINSNIREDLSNEELFKHQQRDYYEVLLQNIYLPSLNVWKDPYTKNFNMSILGQKYLDSDKFQDLYLIQYWSDFVKYVGNDADYNTVDKVSIGDKIVVEGNPEYFYIPITISFSSPNKRSFLLLVNKLSTTSNQNNISLLNEFFFYLLKAIRENKSEVIDQLMHEYREDFSSSSNWEFSTDLSSLTGNELSLYKDRVIGYNLYHWINDGDKKKVNELVDDNVIVKAIKENVSCNSEESNKKCFYKFREKYRNLPYIAYKIGLEVQNDRTAGLLEFLQDLPPAIAITSFSFQKYSNSNFLNNDQDKYEGRVTFNAFGRNISDSELEEASLMLGKLCFGNNFNDGISPQLALNYVNDTISKYGGNHEYDNVPPLLELQKLFTSINGSYGSMSNYDKIIKLFEIWRMMNDGNLCEK